jgi:hypothetical protein
MATWAFSPLAMQRSHKAVESFLVAVAVGTGWALVRSLPQTILTQDGASLEKGLAGTVEGSCCRGPTCCGGGGEAWGGAHQLGPRRPVPAIYPRRGEGGGIGE